MRDVILVFTSVGSEQQAITIAEELIQQELIACVNILPTMRSIYRFNGKVYDDEENLLVIKTTRDLFDAVSVVISQMHTYEVPEIMGIEIGACKGKFLDWVNACCRKPGAPLDQKG
jgi:periplasmic divalent cation tolerance protein